MNNVFFYCDKVMNPFFLKNINTLFFIFLIDNYATIFLLKHLHLTTGKKKTHYEKHNYTPQ